MRTGKIKTFTAEELHPTQNGAWLCRNSWGSSYGKDGYFYISYEEPELAIQENESFYSYDIASPYTYGNKTYANFGVGSSYGLITPNRYSAVNIFTADADDTLAAVSFATFDRNADYTISIYKNTTLSSPTSGTLAASVSGTASNGGYHTVDLPKYVDVTEGESFSIKIVTDDSRFMLDTNNTSSVISYFGNSNSSYLYDLYNFPITQTNADGTKETAYIKSNVFLSARTAADEDIVDEIDPPTGLKAISGGGQALLYWDPVDGAEKYTVYCFFENEWKAVGSVDTPYRVLFLCIGSGQRRGKLKILSTVGDTPLCSLRHYSYTRRQLCRAEVPCRKHCGSL